MKLFILTILPFVASIQSNKPATAKQLTSFPGFAENIAVRHNGHILISSLETSSLHYLEPSTSNKTTLLSPFPNANGISGITELEEDVFAVAAALWNITERRETNASIWTVDFRSPSSSSSAHPNPSLHKIVDLPDSPGLNSLTSIPNTGIVLASDSALGAIHAIDTKHHTSSLLTQDPILAPTGPAANLGVNGIKVHMPWLYFANSGTGVFGRFLISAEGMPMVIGPPERMAQFNGSTDSAIDDFAITRDGNEAYVAFHPSTVFKVDLHAGGAGRKEVVIQGADKVRDPTALAFGRGRRGEGRMLYASVNTFGQEIVGGVDEIFL